jgi:cobalamin biosynthesis Mg chelatase CobN
MRGSAPCSLAAVKAGDYRIRYVVARTKPSRDRSGDAVRLLCDEMLKGIGRWLRAAGYDTAIAASSTSDDDLLAQARAEDGCYSPAIAPSQGAARPVRSCC